MPLEAFYGLPTEVVHCRRCLMTNQKPHSVNETTHTADSRKATLGFDEEGICDACRYAEMKDRGIDWDKREQMLLRLLDQYRRDDGGYDVIVSGSGGKDSAMTSHLLKYKYGMHPLTVTWAPHMYSDIGRQNLQRWIDVGGFDNLLFTANGRVMRTLTHEAFENLYFPFQPFKFGIKFWAAKMAIKFGIKLVMYGEPYIEYGSTPMDDAASPALGLNYFVNDSKDLYLGGMHVDQLKAKHGFCDNDLLPFMPLRSHEVQGHELRVEYLGWYRKWDPQQAYYYAVENCGFEPDDERTEGTYGRYSSIDDRIDGLHYYSHYIKFGIGRCTFDASQEIRNGHITREEGVALLKKYEGEVPRRYMAECLDYIGITEEQFWERTDRARSPHLWHKVDGEWRLRHPLPPDSLQDSPTTNLRYDYLR
jgi:N-acetyl sugar amidotransferase